MSVLEVKNLTHTYDGNTPFVNDAVKDVSFAAEKGEIIGIIGHTGSGKSTLVQHLNGLLKPTAGEILVDNKSIWENPKEIRKIRSKVGLVFQYPEYQLFEETVFKDVAFGPSNMGLSGDELNTRVLDTCRLVGIRDEYLEKSPFDLSGGEKRRVAIAGVMAMRPEIIVFDEPTAGLDPKGREDVMKIIFDYRLATSATVIVISHSMEDMARYCDRLVVMNDGAIMLRGTQSEVFGKADELQSIGLGVPDITKLCARLRAGGMPLPADIYTVEAAVAAIAPLLGGDAHAE